MKRLILAIICVIGGTLLAQQVLALTISPVRLELGAYPGDLIKSQFLLINEEKETKTFCSSFENFQAKGETGQPAFIPEKTGLATWFETASQVTLEPGEQRVVPFSIRVPEDAEPGGHFAAIFWGTCPSQEEGKPKVSIGAKIGMLVLLRVEGEVQEKGKLLEFSTENKKRFFSHLPVSFFYRFENEGNVSLKPKGEIIVKSIFGGASVVLPVNEEGGNVLPKSIRKFQTEWNPKEIKTTEEGFFAGLKREKDNFAFGWYRAKLNLEYGTTKEKAQDSFSFFVIPWRILCLVILALVIMILLFTVGLKKYNQWIIAKAKSK